MAEPEKPRDRSSQLGFILYPNFQISDAMGPAAVFEIGGVMSHITYEISLLPRKGGLIRSSSGIALDTGP